MYALFKRVDGGAELMRSMLSTHLKVRHPLGNVCRSKFNSSGWSSSIEVHPISNLRPH